jgi:hypothetical protein
MSAIAHAPTRTWAATHRALVLVLAVVLVAAAITLSVVLLTRDTTAATPGFPDLPTYDSCAGAAVGTAC